MRFSSATLVATLLASQAAAIALPVPEDIAVGGSDATGDEVADLIAAYEEVADAIPEPVSLPVELGSQSLPEDTGAVIAAASEAVAEDQNLSKRVECKATESKYTTGPDVGALSAEEFKGIPLFRQTALDAATPTGYMAVPNFRALNFIASANNPKGYTTDLTSYDPAFCAARCNAINGCQAFNIFYERTPANNCGTSTAVTVIKCGFWGLPLTASDATNPGQFRAGNFFTSKAGSNGYNAIPDTPEGFTGPVSFGKASIKAPAGQGSTYMTIATYAGVSYSPQACANTCNDITARNQRAAQRAGAETFRSCNFFNSYVAYKNGADPLFTCTFYTQAYGVAQATNVQQFDGDGNKYTKDYSYGYTVAQREVDIRQLD
jgi:hypothetical protein